MRTHEACKTDYNAMSKMDIRHYSYLIASTVFVIQELLDHLNQGPVNICTENLAIPAITSFNLFHFVHCLYVISYLSFDIIYQNSAEKLPCVDIKLNFRFIISTTIDTNAFFGNHNTLYKNGFQTSKLTFL